VQNFNQPAQVAAWLNHAAVHEPFLVALNGHSASGKSTLARGLAAMLPRCQVVAGDDFYRVLAPDDRAALTAQAGYDQYFDWQRLAAQVLWPLREGRPARYQAYDWDQNALGVWKAVRPEGVIVVEGVYSARPELAEYYDAVIYVEAPLERRMQIQRDRGDAPEWIERWAAAEAYYMRTHAPRERADAVFAAV
jgi:uridine kinase